MLELTNESSHTKDLLVLTSSRSLYFNFYILRQNQSAFDSIPRKQAATLLN